MTNTHTIRRATLRRTPHHSSGFTLIELMIVVALLILIASMTVSAINLNTNYDKVRAGSRQVQSYLAGARDRAIYSKAPRGVRFLLDPTNNRTVSSMVFIAPTDPWTQGTIQLERLDANNDNNADNYTPATPNNPPAVIVRGFDNELTSSGYYPTEWVSLYRQGMLKDGARIRIPANEGTWYTVTNTAQLASAGASGSGVGPPPRLRLTTDYIRAGDTDGNSVAAFRAGPQTYLLELPPSILPNQDPVLMPKGAVIHLDRCSTDVEQKHDSGGATLLASNRGNRLPDSWKQSSSMSSDPSGFDYTSQMDLMFSPRGVVIGQAAQRGIIHFYVADQKDADRDRFEWAAPTFYGPANAQATVSVPEYGARTSGSSDQVTRGDKVILSLFARTGAVSTHHVHVDVDLTNPSFNSSPSPAYVNGARDTYNNPYLREYERFKYAETGEVAGK